MWIKPAPLTRRAAVTEYQAKLMAKTMIRLEEVTRRRFPNVRELTVQEFMDFSSMEEYEDFHDVALACNFVSADSPEVKSVSLLNSDPVLLEYSSFAQIRAYIHTLQRIEKWNSQYSDSLFQACIGGALGVVARRLMTDAALRPSADEQAGGIDTTNLGTQVRP